MAGVVANGVYLNTDSGLAAPGGFLDRLTGTFDQVAQNQAQMRGLAPALQATGIPVDAPPPGIFARIAGLTGLAPQQSPAGASGSPPAASPQPGMFAQIFGGAPAPAPAGASAQPQSGPGSLVTLVGQTAQKYGIDPATALKVAMSEGGASGGYGPLHYGGGMGDDFTADTGLDARDPKNVAAAVDYSLMRASKEGWGAFHGAARAGIGRFDGIGQPPAGQAPASAMAYAGPQGAVAAPATAAIGAAAPAGAAPRPPMPLATAEPHVGPSLQPPSDGSAASPQQQPSVDQVRAMLASNDPATKAQGMQAWRAMQQNLPPVGAAPSQAAPSPPAPQSASFNAPATAQPTAALSMGAAAPMTLPGGLTRDALAAMIAEPATRAQGLSLWQNSLVHPFTFANGPEGSGVVLREDPRTGTATPVYQAPIKYDQGQGFFDPSARAPVYQSPPKLEHGPIGRDPNTGVEIYGSIDPQRAGVATPFAQPGGGQGSPSDGLTGQALLDTLPPAQAAQVKAVAEGRLPLPSGNSANNPAAQILRSRVLAYKPDFDSTDTAARAETRKDFASGNVADVVTAGNTALHHLGLLSDAGEALTASQVPIFNAAGQKIENAAGANIAGKQYNDALTAMAGELTKFYRGSGGTEADINAAKALLSPDQSPAQRRASMAQMADLLQGKVSALQDRWHQGMGPQAKDYQLIGPDAASAYARVKGRWPTGAAVGAPGAQPAGPVPVAAPAGASASPGSMPTLTDPSQVRSLASGTKFKTPDGRIGVAP